MHRDKLLALWIIYKKTPATTGVITFLCDSAGARTQDPILKRDVLYLLSY